MTASVPPVLPPPRRRRRPSPAELLAVAEAVCGGKADDYGSSWARAAAVLTRQALEEAVDAIYDGPLAAILTCPTSTKLICLPRYLDDSSLAGQVHAAWAQLSTACHAHPYELDPTLAELQRWIQIVRALLLHTEQAGGTR